MRKIPVIMLAVFLAIALIGVAAGCEAPSETEPAKKVTVGNKNFTEQYIAGELMAQLLEDRGFEVSLTSDLSTMALREGMEADDIDICADYTGTAWMTHLKHEYEPGPDIHNAIYEKVKEEDKGNGFTWLDPMWNHNSYALASWPDFVEEHGLTSVSDLAEYIEEQDGKVKVFVDFEFSTRPDGLPALEEHYGFHINEDYLMTGQAGASLIGLENHNCEVAMVFATDAVIAKHNWHVYTDDKSFWPPYDLTPYVNTDVLNEYPEIGTILNELVATFPGGGNEATLDRVSECQAAWQELNAKVDIDKMEPEEAAEEYLIEHGLIEE